MKNAKTRSKNVAKVAKTTTHRKMQKLRRWVRSPSVSHSTSQKVTTPSSRELQSARSVVKTLRFAPSPPASEKEIYANGVNSITPSSEGPTRRGFLCLLSLSFLFFSFPPLSLSTFIGIDWGTFYYFAMIARHPRLKKWEIEVGGVSSRLMQETPSEPRNVHLPLV